VSQNLIMKWQIIHVVFETYVLKFLHKITSLIKLNYFHEQNQKCRPNPKTTQSGNELFIQHNPHYYNLCLKLTTWIQNLTCSPVAWHSTSTTCGLHVVTFTSINNWCWKSIKINIHTHHFFLHPKGLKICAHVDFLSKNSITLQFDYVWRGQALYKRVPINSNLDFKMN
jgi:hypothetical protein